MKKTDLMMSLTKPQTRWAGMKSNKFLVTLAGLALALLQAAGPAWASCSNAAGTTHGPFSYSHPSPDFFLFKGSGGGPYTTTFTVTAPNDGTLFPGQGQNHGECLESAQAVFKVFEIEKVKDAFGNSLDPTVPIDPNSTLYAQLAHAFSFTNPPGATFTPGSNASVTVTVSDPLLAPADYGDYKVKLGAQAIGAGIGVGSGAIVILDPTGPESADTTAPIVEVTCPGNGSEKLLGAIKVCVEAHDPAPGSGIVSMDASVSSAGGAVSNLAIPLTGFSPVSGTNTATATGSFTPTGGAPTAGPGTSLGQAFFFNSAFDKSLSGNGSYTITAHATDGATPGNPGTGSSTFLVKYNGAFSEAWGNVNSGKPANSFSKFKFTLNRGTTASDGASDGAFMYDKTVTVKLVRTSDDAVMATHSYGTAGGVTLNVLINTTDPLNPFYETHFKRGDLIDPNTSSAPTASAIYVAKVYVRDVDGTWMLQAASSSVTF